MPADKGKGKQREDIIAHAPLFRRQPPSSSSLLTSDPFVPLSTSAIPHRPRHAPTTATTAAPRILAVEISPSALRPLAFRIFTKKHNLTLKSDALVLLCQFIGRRCGSEWRDSGSGEKLLDGIARTWKRNEGPGGILVDGGDALKSVLKGLEVPNATGGEGVGASLLGRQASFDVNLGLPEGMTQDGDVMMGRAEGESRDMVTQELLGVGRGMEGLDPKKYLKVVDAFKQPKWVYNPQKKHFERGQKPTLLPLPQTKTLLFKQRYHLLHQRLLRNESFLPPTFSATARARSSSTTTHYTITPIANLLGHSSQSFLLFGLLTISPSGHLSLTDPTGSIPLDITYATPVPQDGAYFTPGCFVVIDGQYTAEDPLPKFSVLTIGQPPCERREHSADVFGHVDFFGTGTTIDPTSVQNRAMRKIERDVLGPNVRFAIMADVELDVDRTYDALRAVLGTYLDDPPLVCVLMGNFIRIPFGGSISGRSSTTTSSSSSSTQGSIAYKEYWDALSQLLSEFPTILKYTTFVFIPGDNDPFSATFSGGRNVLLPREAIPEYFITRMKRVLHSDGSADPDTRGGIWTSNPARLSYFSHDMVLFRDDSSARLGRNAIRFPKPPPPPPPPPPSSNPPHPDSMDLDQPSSPLTAPTITPLPPPLLSARKLTKTLLDQAHLSPLPLTTRPLLWDFNHTMSLYPLPHTVVLADSSVPPFAVTYEGCHVVNPGRLVGGGEAGGNGVARWVEYVPGEGRGGCKEVDI